jgi:hypothetical protein
MFWCKLIGAKGIRIFIFYITTGRISCYFNKNYPFRAVKLTFHKIFGAQNVLLSRKTVVMKTLHIIVLFFLASFTGQAQRIYYSQIERDDYRQMNFEIIGKVGGNINVYKNYKSNNDISIYDNEMKLKNKVRLDILPDKISNVDFVVYSDYYHMVYQYQKKNVIYFATIKLNGEGKMLSEPVILDTTHVKGENEIKVYTMIYSEDKQKIMVFKINNQNDRYYIFTTLLFDKTLGLQNKSVIKTRVTDKEGVFNDFILDNEGDLAFGRSLHNGGSRDFINRFQFIIKKANEDSLQVTEFPMKNFNLDEIKIRVDNPNRRFLMSSFYYEKSKGNIDGLVSLMWDKASGREQAIYRFKFNDTLRMDARSENGTLKTVFNDYFIKNLIATKDGGFAVVAELYYTNSRTSGWNRYDYLYGGAGGFATMDNAYFSPYSGSNQWRYADPWNRWGNNMVRHYSENIMIFFFNKDGTLKWSNTIQKRQFDDNSDMYLSYQLFNTGNEVRFLFNQLEKREQILNSVTVNAAGTLKRDPTLKGLDKEYDFMPRYGKQVGLREIVLPCMNRNYICFAKMDF